jgi:hypothetical protein
VADDEAVLDGDERNDSDAVAVAVGDGDELRTKDWQQAYWRLFVCGKSFMALEERTWPAPSRPPELFGSPPDHMLDCREIK